MRWRVLLTGSPVWRLLSFKNIRSIPSTFFLLPRLLLMAASSLRRLPLTICPVTGWINPAWRIPDKSMPRDPCRAFTVPNLGKLVLREKGELLPGDPSGTLERSTAVSRQPFNTIGGWGWDATSCSRLRCLTSLSISNSNGCRCFCSSLTNVGAKKPSCICNQEQKEVTLMIICNDWDYKTSSS